MAVKRGGLGKGLDSLIPDHKPKANTSKDKVSEQASGKEKTTMPASGEQKVKITKVEPNRTQPRKNFCSAPSSFSGNNLIIISFFLNKKWLKYTELPDGIC
jgi:hypothetical protein